MITPAEALMLASGALLIAGVVALAVLLRRTEWGDEVVAEPRHSGVCVVGGGAAVKYAADTCADCGTERDSAEMYYVIPPDQLPGGEAFWLCTFCWDRLIGLATVQAFR